MVCGRTDMKAVCQLMLLLMNLISAMLKLLLKKSLFFLRCPLYRNDVYIFGSPTFFSLVYFYYTVNGPPIE